MKHKQGSSTSYGSHLHKVCRMWQELQSNSELQHVPEDKG